MARPALGGGPRGFEAGEPWWLDTDEEKAREEDAEEHTVDDSWESKLAVWATRQAGESYTADEVPGGAFGLESSWDQTKGAAMRMGRALKKLGWERRKGRPVREGALAPADVVLVAAPTDGARGRPRGDSTEMPDGLPDF